MPVWSRIANVFRRERLSIPAAIILGAALLAALPAVFHAVRIDPVATLRAD